jgi:RNA polymerase sigma-70 factor (ECF subfamily)
MTAGVDGAWRDPEADDAVLQRLRAGDPAGLERLMDRYAARVYRVARGITRSDEDAEEVVQDVFLNVFRKIDSFEERSALGTWIYRIAANAALIKRRGRRFERECSLEDVLPAFREDGHRDGERSFLLADWSRTPDEELLSRETRAVLDRALGGLPDAYRAVLVLRDVEGLSTEETAGALGESIGSVKSRLHRARMALREQLTRHLAAAGRAAPDPLVSRTPRTASRV